MFDVSIKDKFDYKWTTMRRIQTEKSQAIACQHKFVAAPYKMIPIEIIPLDFDFEWN